MSEYTREKQLQRKREYYREWRKTHQESVRAANIRYWLRKAAEMNQTVNADTKTRNAEEGLS